MSFKKYYLIDPNRYNQLTHSTSKPEKLYDDSSKEIVTVRPEQNIFTPPHVRNVYKLEDEMKRLLNDTQLSDYEKAEKYGTLLERYLRNIHVEQKSPSQELSSHVEESPSVSVKDESNKQKDSEMFLSTIPKSYQRQARSILNFIKKSPTIEWNKSGSLIYKGKPVNNTSLPQVLNDTVRKRVPVSSSEGVETFINILKSEGYKDIHNINFGRTVHVQPKKKKTSKLKGWVESS